MDINIVFCLKIQDPCLAIHRFRLTAHRECGIRAVSYKR